MVSAFPEFSIIIPTCGRLNSLRNCLDGLGRMDYPQNRCEVIVVNDGGPFLNRGDVIPSGMSMAIHILNQCNRGPASARNAGVTKAKGQYLAFLDDDCVPSPDWLNIIAERALSRDGCAVGGRTVNLLSDNPFAAASQMMVDYLYRIMNERPEEARFLTTNNLVVPKDRFLNMGGFDSRYTRPAGEDREFCRRWIQSGYGMVYIPKAVVFHAHELRFADYLRQHFAYGQGAFQYHWGEGRAVSSRLETLAFYWNLVVFPLHQPEASAKYRLTLLMALSQAATAAGVTCGLGSSVLKMVRRASRAV